MLVLHWIWSLLRYIAMLYLWSVCREHSEPSSGKLPPSPLIVRYSNNSNKYMAVHGRARWFYENMVDSGQYHTVETIIGLRGGGGVCCLHRDNEFPLGRNYTVACDVFCEPWLLRSLTLWCTFQFSIYLKVIYYIIYHNNKIFTLLT